MPDATRSDTRARHIVLMGAMGAGKSTIGVPLATALGRPFLDNDAQLFERAGATAAELAERDGVNALHRAEVAAVLASLDTPGAAVITAAASTITDPEVRHALARDAFVVWLRAAPDALAARLAQPSSRPFAAEEPAHLVAGQARERDALFEQTADLVVMSDRSTPAAVVTEILEHLPEALKPNR